MKRKALVDLGIWLNETNRKPLVLRGPRQVGKSTLVKDFAKSQKLTLHEVNLERYQYLSKIIKASRVEDFLKEVQIISNKGNVVSENSILFIDEIQAIPEGLQFLRYLYEDYPALPIISAGSLLEFALQDESNAFSMPVGRVSYQFLGPCTFNEYLEAKEEIHLLEHLSKYEVGMQFSEIVHEKLLLHLRSFMIVGGMPEALQLFVDTDDYSRARKILSSIVLTYRDDFLKYARKTSLQNLQKVLDYVPVGLGKKVKYVNIDDHVKAVDLRFAVKLLDMAGVLSVARSTNAMNPPLFSGVDSKAFKLYVLDCGVLNALSKVSLTSLDVRFSNEDDISEQFVAQHLKYMGPTYEPPELYYWLREGKANNAEVDFLYQSKNTIVPIEVKSGSSGKLRSLHQYMYRSKAKLAVRFDLNPPSLQKVEFNLTEGKGERVSFELLSLPLYMVGEMDRLIG